MKVEYLRHSGSDLDIVDAARVSFAKASEWERGKHETGIPWLKLKDEDAKLIRYLAKHNHWSPFAHTSVSFRIEAPIFVARQLGKHQVGLVWNEVSRRYVDDVPSFYRPKSWRGRAASVKQGSGGDIKEQAAATEVVNAASAMCLRLYNNLLKAGVCPEQARMVLPQSMNTSWIWTGSLVAFDRVCKLRLDPHTQVETREIAKGIAEACDKLFPVSWEALQSCG